MNPKQPIHVQDLGLLDYEKALAFQREHNQAVIDGHGCPTVLLVEHPPGLTLTRRSKPNLLADVYPILKLGDFGLNLSSYMRLLERAVIDTIATWGVAGHAECGATGVWVNSSRGAGDAQRPVPSDVDPVNPNTEKICAMGVRIRKNTTMHGLALNIDPDMSHFNLIVPCGLEGRPVTSLKQLLGDDCPSMKQVKEVFTQSLLDCLQITGPSTSWPTGSAPGTTAGS